MLHNENIRNRNPLHPLSHVFVDCKLTITKEITCDSKKHVDLVVDNLEKLKKDKFERIKVPQFFYEVSGLTITETCEFIKGHFLTPKYERIVLNELVKRENDYTFADYHYRNFIVKNRDIYSIDLSSYCYIPDRYERNYSWVNRQTYQTELNHQ